MRGGGAIEATHKSHNFLYDSTLQPLDKPLCLKPFDEIWINSDCSLILCCQDFFASINFGSLLTEDFLKLYHSQTFEEIRQMHNYGCLPNNHLCKQCLDKRFNNYYKSFSKYAKK